MCSKGGRRHGISGFEGINIALLAKQGWQLQTCPNSLFHRVYKAKYFPHGDFLSAPLGRNLSYSWRSIMATQKIVQIGYQWQIGNGESVGLWSDKWLPIPSSYKPPTFPHFFPDDAKVFALINPKTASWKSDIIHEVFLPFDAEAMLSIPLSPTLPEDRLIWAVTLTGRFSVSSAYRITRIVMDEIKAFAWRDCGNILPTKANLYSRKVIPDNICEECGVDVESLGHVFWHCARAKEVWSAANVEFGADLGEVSEFLDLVWYARNVKQWSFQALACLFTIACGIWSNRNEIRTGGARKSASVIGRWTMDYLEEFRLANHKIQVQKPQVEVGWTFPHLHVSKLMLMVPCLKGRGLWELGW